MTASLERPELFAEIFDRHAAAIHRYFARRVGELADDLLSEAFLIAFRCRASYRPERVDVRPWLYGISANLVRRHEREEVTRYRALARSAGAAMADTATPDGGLEELMDRVDASRLRPLLAAALAELDPRDREVLLLVAWADLTYPQVAAAMDVPVGTVRSRLHRARRRVRERLGADPSPGALIELRQGDGTRRRTQDLTDSPTDREKP